MPDFLQLPDNNAINVHFSSEVAELERNLAKLPKEVTEGREFSPKFDCL